MERVEIPVSSDFECIVDAVERGDDVVLTRDGKIVAHVKRAELTRQAQAAGGKIDWDAVKSLHAGIPDELRGKGAEMVMELRESYRS